MNTIEILESRIAPAAVFHFTDVDGDKVTVHSSKGSNFALANAAHVVGGQLQLLDLSGASFGAEFSGANISITATKSATGDGHVNVGFINATGEDLGMVKVSGDLGRIKVGDADIQTTGLKSLSVLSLGKEGTTTQAAGGSLGSAIVGDLTTLSIKGDMSAYLAAYRIGTVTIGGAMVGGASNTGQIEVVGDIGSIKIAHDLKGGYGGVSGIISSDTGSIGSVAIGGSIIGGTANDTGEIVVAKNIGSLKIGHDLQGGAGIHSGSVSNYYSYGKIGNVAIGGSIIGGKGVDSGEISSKGAIGRVSIGHDLQGGEGLRSGYLYNAKDAIAGVTIGGSILGGAGGSSGDIGSAGDIGFVKVLHDVKGGSGAFSGSIATNGGKIAGVKIGGSLIGGTNSATGVIKAEQSLGPIRIGHDLQGGSIAGSASLDDSGTIASLSGRIVSVNIHGSILAGADASTGTLGRTASILAGLDIGSVKVGGSIVGTHSASGDGIVVISAEGSAIPGPTTDLAIAKITVLGRVENAKILAGYDTSGVATNADAQIGAITAGGDWIASSAVAGAFPGNNGNYGDADDAIIGGGGNPAIVSKIASIVIGGQIVGTPTGVNATDHYGFVAQQIGSFKAKGFSAKLTAGLDSPIELSPTTGDVTIREI